MERDELERLMLEEARTSVKIRTALDRTHRYWVYVIELNGGNFYVGETDNVVKRLVDHVLSSKSSSQWVKLHGFRRVIEIVRNADADAEETKTLAWMTMFGFERVRGASFTYPHITRAPFKLATFDRRVHVYDHLSHSEVAAIEEEARRLSRIVCPPREGVLPPSDSPPSDSPSDSPSPPDAAAATMRLPADLPTPTQQS